MQEIGPVITEITKRRTSAYNVEEIFKGALKNEYVKEFIKENEVSDETLKTYRSEIIQYVMRSASGETLELMHTQTYKHAVIELREQPPKPAEKPKRLKFDDLNSALRGVTFKDLQVDLNNEKLINALQRFTLSFSEGKHKQGIWVHGNFGRGKSFILGALANELHATGVDVTFISLKHFVDNYMARDFGEKEAYLQGIAKTEVLILDDVGAEHLSEFSVKLIYELMANRYAHKRTTFASSNLTITEYNLLLQRSNAVDVERLIERLRHLFAQFKLDGENYRERMK